MNKKRYGSFDLRKPTKVKYAVMVVSYDNKYCFVTDLDRKTKQWNSERGKEALYFDDINVARDLAYAIMINGCNAWVVEVLGNSINKLYDRG